MKIKGSFGIVNLFNRVNSKAKLVDSNYANKRPSALNNRDKTFAKVHSLEYTNMRKFR